MFASSYVSGISKLTLPLFYETNLSLKFELLAWNLKIQRVVSVGDDIGILINCLLGKFTYGILIVSMSVQIFMYTPWYPLVPRFIVSFDEIL
jgi:hypothetical protein